VGGPNGLHEVYVKCSTRLLRFDGHKGGWKMGLGLREGGAGGRCQGKKLLSWKKPGVVELDEGWEG